ncbi:hypothetical protein [Okeania sp. SIO3I5]|uniref:hypothetical protein n=1 Tax=Okeania sp. SIO3I5 TaxID=2607805 RepID=UPI0025DDF957|nr:hypothetical protein [Okeania sp. SIO3I5]
MFGINLQAKYLRKIITFLITVVLISGLVSCSDRLPELSKFGSEKSVATSTTSKISEVSPPKIIQQLRQAIDIYKPQLAIQSPQPDQIFEDNDISVQLQVKDLPIFKSDLDLGPYVEVILDDQHYTKIYNLDESIVLSDLEPGTHTLRVFACRPWDESFKNEGAYAQTTFHIFTKTANNDPAPDLPLLTYNSPVGSYGAEPIMIDYYLTNAPLHSVAREDSEDEIADWGIRVTVNGTSFITDGWEPIYLQGFDPGKNWVKLEYIDESGNPVNNVYNNTVRLITYKPDGEDTLSKIIRGEISLKEALSIVDREYIYEKSQPETTSETEEITIDEELEVDETLVEPISEEITTDEELEVDETLVEPISEEITTDEELEVDETLVEPISEEITTDEELEVDETLVEPISEEITTDEELEVDETLVEPISEEITTDEELEVDEILVEPISEEITTDEELEVDETLVEPTQAIESEKIQALKEKIEISTNWIKNRFKDINQLINKLTEPTSEESLNVTKESETEDSLEQNELSNVLEIVDELPRQESVKEMPLPETSNLTPNLEEVTESMEDYSIDQNEDYQEETTIELEEIMPEKSNVVVDFDELESDDSASDLTQKIEPENILDSVEAEEIMPEKSELVVEFDELESDDLTSDVTQKIEPENILDSAEAEEMIQEKSEVVVEFDELESDDSASDVTQKIESENILDSVEAEEIMPEKSELVVEFDELESDDSASDVTQKIESENILDSVEAEEIMPEKSELVVDFDELESDDSASDVTQKIESENILDSVEAEEIMPEKSELVVDFDELESDDSASDVTQKIESENILDSVEAEEIMPEKSELVVDFDELESDDSASDVTQKIESENILDSID